MNISFRLLLLSFLLLFITNSYSQNAALPRKIVFVQSEIIDTTKTSLKDLKDRLINATINRLNADLETPEEKAFAESLVKIAFKTTFEPSSGEKKTVIECDRDSIWKSFWVNNQMLGDWERISKDGELFRHFKANRRLCYDTIELQDDRNKYSVETYRNMKKIILGYNCYKVIIIEKNTEEESAPFKAGNTFYTLYVTDSISLPLQAIQYLPVKIEGFPLEITREDEHFPGHSVVYRASVIEK